MSDLTNDSNFISSIPAEYVTESEMGTAINTAITELVGNAPDTLNSIEEKIQFVDDLYSKHSRGVNLVKQTYLANYEIKDFHLDVHFLDGKDYVDKVDLMVGGSPCQSFSSNGKRGGFADTRGTLFHDYARIISEVHPKAFIFENVKGMLVHDNGNTWKTIKNTFRELNYNIYIRKDENGNEIEIKTNENGEYVIKESVFS